MPPKRARHGWIETVAPEHATGLLAKLFAADAAKLGVMQHDWHFSGSIEPLRRFRQRLEACRIAQWQGAVERAGRVFNILRIQSPRPETLRISTLLYREVMFAEQSPLSRAQREMIATAVSRANACEY